MHVWIESSTTLWFHRHIAVVAVANTCLNNHNATLLKVYGRGIGDSRLQHWIFGNTNDAVVNGDMNVMSVKETM